MGPKNTLAYAIIGSYTFAMLLQKLNFTQTKPQNAAAIRKITGQMEEATKLLHKAYDEKVGAIFHEKDKDGKAILVQAEKGQEHKIIPGKEAEYEEALKKFNEEGEHTFDLTNCRPLSPGVLVDVKLNANEIGMLGCLYSEQDGPGIP